MDSVPPLVTRLVYCIERPGINILGKRGSNKDGCKAANASDKWRIANVPVFAADVLVVGVSTTINRDTKDNEYHYGDDFQQAEPILCLNSRLTQ